MQESSSSSPPLSPNFFECKFDQVLLCSVDEMIREFGFSMPKKILLHKRSLVTSIIPVIFRKNEPSLIGSLSDATYFARNIRVSVDRTVCRFLSEAYQRTCSEPNRVRSVIVNCYGIEDPFPEGASSSVWMCCMRFNRNSKLISILPLYFPFGNSLEFGWFAPSVNIPAASDDNYDDDNDTATSTETLPNEVEETCCCSPMDTDENVVVENVTTFKFKNLPNQILHRDLKNTKTTFKGRFDTALFFEWRRLGCEIFFFDSQGKRTLNFASVVEFEIPLNSRFKLYKTDKGAAHIPVIGVIETRFGKSLNGTRQPVEMLEKSFSSVNVSNLCDGSYEFLVKLSKNVLVRDEDSSLFL